MNWMQNITHAIFFFPGIFLHEVLHLIAGVIAMVTGMIFNVFAIITSMTLVIVEVRNESLNEGVISLDEQKFHPVLYLRIRKSTRNITQWCERYGINVNM